MKVLSALVIVLILACFSGERAQEQTAATGESLKISVGDQSRANPAKTKTPVLVELFTSEGCPTCPPAERLLARLQNEQPHPEAEIITLALHVDYWNRGGWTDRFSSPLYSQRQEIYGDKFKIPAVYTPQMVVDGSRYFVGSNSAAADRAISEAVKAAKAKIEMSLAGDNLKIKITDIPAHETAAVFLAVAEDNLTTAVKRGENSGLTLIHSSVARLLKPLGRVAPADNSFEISSPLDFDPDWKKNDLKIIVFLQETRSRKILAVDNLLLYK